MPWGQHKGKTMADVPADYLDWLRDQDWLSTWPGLHGYIANNMSRIDKELEENAPAKPEGDDGFDDYEDYKRNG